LEKEIIIKVAKNSYGLAVMKIVIKFTESMDTRKRLMSVIAKHTSKLVMDPYGNYVLQESLDNWGDTDSKNKDDPVTCFFAGVFNHIIGKINKLAVQKFSSNVIEKCLEKANDHHRRIFILEIINGDPIAIMKNSYGNYVFQKSLALAKGINKFQVIDIIFKNFPMIQEHKIKMKWIKLLKKYLKPEDALQAEDEQDTMNLDEEQCVNYSHKFKLINDEISKYDAGPNKNKNKGKAKKCGQHKDSYANSNNSKGYHQPYNQGYGAGPSPNVYDSNNQFQVNFQGHHEMIPPPMVSYGVPLGHSYNYPPPGHGYHPMAGIDPNAGVTYPENYYNQVQPGYPNQRGYQNGVYKQQ
jgi:hypothetical protein